MSRCTLKFVGVGGFYKLLSKAGLFWQFFKFFKILWLPIDALSCRIYNLEFKKTWIRSRRCPTSNFMTIFDSIGKFLMISPFIIRSAKSHQPTFQSFLTYFITKDKILAVELIKAFQNQSTTRFIWIFTSSYQICKIC